MKDEQPKPVKESLRGVEKRPIEIATESVREAKRKAASDGNPYPNKLRD